MSKSFNAPNVQNNINEANVTSINNNNTFRNFVLPAHTYANESQQLHPRLQPNPVHHSSAFPFANNPSHVQPVPSPFLHQNNQQVQSLLHQFQNKYAPTHATVPSSQYTGNVNYQHQPNNASGFPQNEKGHFGGPDNSNNWYSNGVSGYQHQHQNVQSRSNNHVQVSESLLNKFPTFAPFSAFPPHSNNDHHNGFVTVSSSNTFQSVAPVKLPSLSTLFSEKAPMHSQLSPFLSDKHQGTPSPIAPVTSVVNEEFIHRTEAPVLSNNFQQYTPTYEQAAPITKLPPYPSSGKHHTAPSPLSTQNLSRGALALSNSARELSNKASPAGSSDSETAFTESPSSWANSSFMITMNNMTNGGDGAATRAARDELHELSDSDDETDDSENNAASPIQRKKGKQLAPKSRKMKKKTSLSRKTVNFDQMAKLFVFTEAEAAEKLGISKSKLKRLKKKMNIQRWPFRRLQSLKKEIASVKNLIQVAKTTGDSRESIQALNQRLHDLELTVQFIRSNPNTITKYKNEAIIKMIRTAQKVAVRNLLNTSNEEQSKQGIEDMTPEEVFKHVFATPPVLEQLEADTTMNDEQNSTERQSTASSSSGSSGCSPSEQSTPPTPSTNLNNAKT